MKVYALLLLIVGCCGLQWKALNDFKGNFKKYVILSLNTTSSIRNILDVSRLNAEYFINNTYSNNKLVKRITKMRTSNDKCFTGIVDEKTLKAFFANRIDKFQIPLRRRFLQIKQILNKIISLMDNYERFARRIFRVCNPLIKNCLKETNEWLKSTLNSLSCAIRPKCQVNNNVTNHLIRKRASCTTRQFSCKYGKCISSKMFCNGICDCADCSDEPPDCRRHCSEFRCAENFNCISYDKKCNGIDDCGDGTDEVGCQQISITRPPYRGRNCSIVEGKFLCRNMKCIELQKVCDGHNTCGDWSDEGVHCKVGQCSPRCGRLGGVCISRPKGSECVIECPPGTYETSKGCNLKPEAPLTSLVQILEDTPRLKKRYIARLKFLKKNTIKMIYKSLVDILKCKKRRFSILSAIVRMSNRTINYRSLNNHTDIEETEDHKTNKETPETKTNTTTLETTPNTAISMLHGNENLTISPQILNNSPQHTRRGRNRKTKKKEKMEKHEKHLDEDVAEIDFSHASEYEENDKVTNGPTTASTDNTTPSLSNTVSDKPDRTTVEKITAGANSYVTEADGRNETNTTDLETTLNTTTSILHVNKSSETTSKNTIPMTFLSSKPGGHENNKAENFNFDGVSHGNNKTKEEADTIKTNETTKQPSKQENQGSARIDDFDSGMKSNQSTEIKKEPTITPINETTPETSSNSTIPGVVKPENQGIKAGNDAYTDGRIGEDYDSEKKKKMNLRKTKGPRNKTNLETISKTTTLALQAVNVGAEDINMMGDERLGGIEEQETEDDKSNKTTKTNTTTQETTSDPTTLLSHMDKSTESKVSYEMTKTNKTTLVSISNPTTAATFLSSNPEKYENDKSNFGGGSHENNKTKEDQKPTRTNETSTLTTLQSPEGVNNGTDDPLVVKRNNKMIATKKGPDTSTSINSTTSLPKNKPTTARTVSALSETLNRTTLSDIIIATIPNNTLTATAPSDINITDIPTNTLTSTNPTNTSIKIKPTNTLNRTTPSNIPSISTNILTTSNLMDKNITTISIKHINTPTGSNINNTTVRTNKLTTTNATNANITNILTNTLTITTNINISTLLTSTSTSASPTNTNIITKSTNTPSNTNTTTISQSKLNATTPSYMKITAIPTDTLTKTDPTIKNITTIPTNTLTTTNPTNTSIKITLTNILNTTTLSDIIITTIYNNTLTATAPSDINITDIPTNTLTSTNPTNTSIKITPTNTLNTTTPSNIPTISTNILTTTNLMDKNITTISIKHLNTLNTPNESNINITTVRKNKLTITNATNGNITNILTNTLTTATNINISTLLTSTSTSASPINTNIITKSTNTPSNTNTTTISQNKLNATTPSNMKITTTPTDTLTTTNPTIKNITTISTTTLTTNPKQETTKSQTLARTTISAATAPPIKPPVLAPITKATKKTSIIIPKRNKPKTNMKHKKRHCKKRPHPRSWLVDLRF